MNLLPRLNTNHKKPELLADVLAGVMSAPKAGLAQRYEMAGQISSAWMQLLPPELAQHCRVTDLSAGVLTVEADSPSYLYEIRIISLELIELLKENCPAGRVRAIKVMLAH